jgi:hypothetical protein
LILLEDTREEEDTHMADSPRDRDSDKGDNTGLPPDREPIRGVPRWVKVFGIIAVVASLLFIILLFTRGPAGGPGGHTPMPLGGDAPSGSRP